MTVDNKSTVDQIDSFITSEYVLGTTERKGGIAELIALEYMREYFIRVKQ